MPVGKTIMSGVLGDKYDKTYTKLKKRSITHENEYNFFRLMAHCSVYPINPPISLYILIRRYKNI